MGNLEKLKTFIKNINIIREEDVVYLFVLIRKIIEDSYQNADSENDKKCLRLKFYCDWPLHNVLSRKSAIITLSLPGFPDALVKLEELREELIKFCYKYQLENLENKVLGNWDIFKMTYIGIISNSILEVSDNEFNNIKHNRFKCFINNTEIGDLKFINFIYDEH